MSLTRILLDIPVVVKHRQQLLTNDRHGQSRLTTTESTLDSILVLSLFSACVTSVRRC